jgi:hypothetical protein
MYLSEKFNEKVELIPESTCHYWVGAIGGNGYGTFTYLRKTVLAHRISYKFYKGEIPEGMCVLHKCDNRMCVNPDHLFLGTHKDNMDDMKNKSRAAAGSKNSQSKLTQGDVDEIREKLKTNSARRIAYVYGVSKTTIIDIKYSRIWVN